MGALFSLERSALYYWHGDPGSGLKYITVRRGDGHVSPLREFEVCGVVGGELVAFGKHEHLCKSAGRSFRIHCYSEFAQPLGVFKQFLPGYVPLPSDLATSTLLATAASAYLVSLAGAHVFTLQVSAVSGGTAYAISSNLRAWAWRP